MDYHNRGQRIMQKYENYYRRHQRFVYDNVQILPYTPALLNQQQQFPQYPEYPSHDLPYTPALPNQQQFPQYPEYPSHDFSNFVRFHRQPTFDHQLGPPIPPEPPLIAVSGDTHLPNLKQNAKVGLSPHEVDNGSGGNMSDRGRSSFRRKGSRPYGAGPPWAYGRSSSNHSPDDDARSGISAAARRTAWWCTLCRLDCKSRINLEQHKIGKRHKYSVIAMKKTQNQEAKTGQESASNPNSNIKAEYIQSRTVEGYKRSESHMKNLSSEKATRGDKIESKQTSGMLEKSEVQSTNPRKYSREGFVPEYSIKRKTRRGDEGRKYMRSNEGIRRLVKTPKPKQEGFPKICDLCNVKCESQVVLDSHLNGKRHLVNLEQFHGKYVSGELGPKSSRPPNSDAQLMSSRPQVQQQESRDSRVLEAQQPTCVPPQTQAPEVPGTSEAAAGLVPSPPQGRSLELHSRQVSQNHGSEANADVKGKDVVSENTQPELQPVTTVSEAQVTLVSKQAFCEPESNISSLVAIHEGVSSDNVVKLITESRIKNPLSEDETEEEDPEEAISGHDDPEAEFEEEDPEEALTEEEDPEEPEPEEEDPEEEPIEEDPEEVEPEDENPEEITIEEDRGEDSMEEDPEEVSMEEDPEEASLEEDPEEALSDYES